jgi:tripartite-type tricarboxylate transporter receptor subunit TctC
MHSRLTLLALTLLVAAPLCAAQQYPQRPLRLIITFPPGGSTDFVGRLVAQKMSESLGQQVVADNRGGAGGIVGTMIAAHAAPDGYTLILGSSSGLVFNPLLNAKLPYDPFRDFEPISRTNINAQALVAHPGVAASNVKELIALAKARPGQLNVSSPGIGSSNHVGAEMFNHLAGVNIVHVAYKGSGPAAIDLMAGNIQLQMTSIPTVMPHVKAGKMKMLGVGSSKRSALLPDVPTIAESGVPGYDDTVWYGLFAPKGTPATIVSRLNSEALKALASPDLVQRFLSQGAEPSGSSPRELAEFMRAEHVRWAKIIKAANIRLE